MFEKLANLLSSNKYALAIGWCFTVGVPVITALLSKLYLGLVLFAVLIFILAVLLKHSTDAADRSGNITAQKDTGERNSYTLSTTIPATVELIGREKDIKTIYSLLEQNDIVSIRADGGVGKTAVAAKIVNEIKRDVVTGNSQYEHAVWITSTGNLKNDLTSLDIPSVKAAKTLEDKYQAACVFLQNIPTFIVIDNMDQPLTQKEVNDLNTISGKTKLLITARADNPVVKEYPLKYLDPDSALILLYWYFEKKKLTTDQIRARDDRIFGENIVGAAAGNALFIELIGDMAYADHWSLEKLWDELKVDVFGIDSRYPIKAGHGDDGKLQNHIQKLYKMAKLSERQKEIMSFMTLFPAEYSIFFDVFKWAGFEDDEEDNLGELQKRGWIVRDNEGYLIHTIVKGSVERQKGKEAFDEKRYRNLILELAATDQYIPRDMVYTKVRERIVVLETVCKLLSDKGNKTLSTSALYNKLANVYREQGNYEEALEYHRKVFAIQKKVLGTENRDTAATYNNLANVYSDQGNYEEALEYYGKALAIKKKVLGTENRDTATTYNNMAIVYSDQGKYEEALEYFGKALAIQEKVLGTENRDTAVTYDNMAIAYSAQGNYEEALEYCGKAIAIWEKVQGKEDPDTARTYNNMATVYSAQGNYAEALEYCGKARAIQEKVLGAEHPDTAATFDSLATVYSAQGNYEGALKYYGKALAILEKVLGTEHPDTAATYNNLATMYSAQGNYEKALEYYGKALAIKEKVLGTEHPSTKSTKEALEQVKKELNK